MSFFSCHLCRRRIFFLGFCILSGNLIASEVSFKSAIGKTSRESVINKTWLQTQADQLYFQAERAIFHNKKEQALDLLNQALLFNGQSAFLRGKLADLYVLEGLYSQAFFQYQSILKKDPTNTDMQFQLAKIYREGGLYREALLECKALLKQFPRNFAFGFEEVLIYRDAGFYKKALIQIEKMISLAFKEEKIKLYLLKSQVYKLLKKPRLQKQTLKKVVALNPVKETFIRSLLAHYMDLGDIKSARDYLFDYQEKNEFSIYVAKVLSEILLISNEKELLYKQLHRIQAFGALDNFETFQLAALLVEKKQYDKAFPLFIDLLLDKKFISPAHYFLGFLYEQKREKNKAKEHYKKVLFLDEYFFNARTRWAYLLTEENQWGKAFAIMKELNHQFQKTPLSFLTYARFLKDGNRPSEAIKVLDQAVSLFPKHLDTLFLRGVYLEEVGQTDLALKSMENILKINSNYVDALNFLAYAYAQNKGPLKIAEQMVRKALSLSPKSGYILDTLGWVLYKRGQPDKALAYLQKAFKINEKESVIAEHLGEVYHVLKQYGKSAFYFKKAAILETDRSKRENLEKRIALAQAHI